MDLDRGRPVVLQDVETNTSELVDVGVVDFRTEKDLRWHHGVLVRQEELTGEETAFIGCLGGSGQLHVEVAEVVLVGLNDDSFDRIAHEPLRFFHNPWRDGHL